MNLKNLFKKAEKDFIRRSYEKKRRRILEQLGEYFYKLYLSGEVTEVPEEIMELIEKLRHIDKKIVKLENDEN